MVGIIVVTSVVFGAWAQAGAARHAMPKKSAQRAIPAIEGGADRTVGRDPAQSTSGVARTGTPSGCRPSWIGHASPARAPPLSSSTQWGRETRLGPRGSGCRSCHSSPPPAVGVQMAVYPPGVANPTEGAPPSGFRHSGQSMHRLTTPGTFLALIWCAPTSQALTGASQESCPSTRCPLPSRPISSRRTWWPSPILPVSRATSLARVGAGQ